MIVCKTMELYTARCRHRHKCCRTCCCTKPLQLAAQEKYRIAGQRKVIYTDVRLSTHIATKAAATAAATRALFDVNVCYFMLAPCYFMLAPSRQQGRPAPLQRRRQCHSITHTVPLATEYQAGDCPPRRLPGLALTHSPPHKTSLSFLCRPMCTTPHLPLAPTGLYSTGSPRPSNTRPMRSQLYWLPVLETMQCLYCGMCCGTTRGAGPTRQPTVAHTPTHP